MGFFDILFWKNLGTEEALCQIQTEIAGSD